MIEQRQVIALCENFIRNALSVPSASPRIDLSSPHYAYYAFLFHSHIATQKQYSIGYCFCIAMWLLGWSSFARKHSTNATSCTVYCSLAKCNLVNIVNARVHARFLRACVFVCAFSDGTVGIFLVCKYTTSEARQALSSLSFFFFFLRTSLPSWNLRYITSKVFHLRIWRCALSP